MTSPFLTQTRAEALHAGLNLFGLVDGRRFDRSQPKELRAERLVADCGTIIVLGSGGSASAKDPPIAATTLGLCAGTGLREIVRELIRLLRPVRPSQIVYAGSRRQLNFASLAEAAGFGTVSPVTGRLLHPQYGLWLRPHAALLFVGLPFGEIADASIVEKFNPCCSCSRPCLNGSGQHDLTGSHHDANGPCAAGHVNGHACPVGREHRDAQGDGWHPHLAPMVTERHSDAGVWRLLPWFRRGGP